MGPNTGLRQGPGEGRGKGWGLGPGYCRLKQNTHGDTLLPRGILAHWVLGPRPWDSPPRFHPSPKVSIPIPTAWVEKDPVLPWRRLSPRIPAMQVKVDIAASEQRCNGEVCQGT